MSWWSIVPHLCLGIGVLFVPGLCVGWVSRLRGIALLAVAPAITVSIVAVAALIAPLINMRWSIVPVGIFALIVAAIAWVATKLLSPAGAAERPRTQTPIKWLNVGGQTLALVAAAFLISRRLVVAFGRPEAFSQTFDNVFHLNAVRYILDTGSGSSITVSGMTGGGFYPAAWHDLVALIAVTTGASIPVSVNVINLIVGSIVWPLGCILLAHKVLGERVAVSVAAGILSAAFGAFPLLLLDFGVLYPNFLGNALLPIAVALGIQALGLGWSSSRSAAVSWLLFAAVLPGLTLAHPSSTMALLAMLLPPLLILWFRGVVAIRRRSQHVALRLGGMALLLLLGLGAAVVLWKAIRPPEVAAFWPPIETTGRAIGEVLTSSAIGRSVSWAVALLAVAGLISVIRRRQQYWLIGMFVVIASLFVIVASFPFGSLRTFFTGVWYNDPPRLASLLPMVLLPFAVVGAVRGWDRWLEPQLRGLASRSRRKTPLAASKPLAAVGAVAVICLLTLATQQANVREATNSAAAGYRLANDSPLVSSDEMTLMNRLPAEVPQDAVLVGNPWNGSALAYAFTGRKLVQLHMLSELPSGAVELFTRLNTAKTDPTICPIVQKLHVGYVLDFGHQEVHGGDNGFRGLDNLVASGVASLVDSQGQAKIYKLTACGQ